MTICTFAGAAGAIYIYERAYTKAIRETKQTIRQTEKKVRKELANEVQH